MFDLEVIILSATKTPRPKKANPPEKSINDVSALPDFGRAAGRGTTVGAGVAAVDAVAELDDVVIAISTD